MSSFSHGQPPCCARGGHHSLLIMWRAETSRGVGHDAEGVHTGRVCHSVIRKQVKVCKPTTPRKSQRTNEKKVSGRSCPARAVPGCNAAVTCASLRSARSHLHPAERKAQRRCCQGQDCKICRAWCATHKATTSRAITRCSIWDRQARWLIRCLNIEVPGGGLSAKP